MFYVLAEADALRKKGVRYFRTMPDGRGIIEGSELKCLGNLNNVDIVASYAELKKKIEEQSKKKEE